MSEQNVKMIQDIYGAFGRGDVAGILEHCADDTEWGYNGARSEVPWHPTFRGKGSVPNFIQAFVSNVDLHDFRPKAFIHSGDELVCNVAIESTVKKTGQRVKQEHHHWWTLRDGKGKHLVHFER